MGEYEWARERYEALGVDVEAALRRLDGVAVSLHCWQGDDVGGFESAGKEPPGGELGAAMAVTGDYPGKARNVDELRADMEFALGLVPGRHRVNVHAMYGEFGGRKVDRDAIGPEHFAGWVDWCKARGLGLDFNATLFAHPRAASGWTLSHPDAGVRRFWIEHVERCRRIGAWMGERLGTPCMHNLWIPDGSKDVTVSRLACRERLRRSLDEIYATTYPREELKDSVEGKLFGIGSESFVVGSHEFYLAWALEHGVMVCLDMGHYHPTEFLGDKVSALLPFMDELLVHVSRGVRWDSDHVVIVSDDLRDLLAEVVRADALGRVHLALDYFDASINRVGAWVIGMRATLRAMLEALLEPVDRLRQYEAEGDGFRRLALLEECKSLPHGAVWHQYCESKGVPGDERWLEQVKDYERRVQGKRGR